MKEKTIMVAKAILIVIGMFISAAILFYELVLFGLLVYTIAFGLI